MRNFKLVIKRNFNKFKQRIIMAVLVNSNMLNYMPLFTLVFCVKNRRSFYKCAYPGDDFMKRKFLMQLQTAL